MSKSINSKTIDFYKILLSYLKVERTTAQCAKQFGLTDHHMRYHITQLNKSGCIAFSGNYHGNAKMHIKIKDEYVHVATEPVEYKDRLPQRTIQLSPFITQYNLMETQHNHREPKKSPKVYIGSTMGMV